MAEPVPLSTAYRTHALNEIQANGASLIDVEVTVCGFMEANRGKGKICFVDLRDGTGKCQIFLKEGNVDETILTEIQNLSRESTIQVQGVVAQNDRRKSRKANQLRLQNTKSSQIMPPF